MQMNVMMNQNIAIIGAGKTGLSVARFCKEHGIAFTLFDETEPNTDMGFPVSAGPLDSQKLVGFTKVVVSPGVAWQHPALQQARKDGAQMCGDLDMFLEHYQGSVIAVTGTNGKTTTTEMIGLLLETLPGGCKTGGNIGVPMLDLLNESDMPVRVALELSSFQLERSNGLKPDVAVFLNIQADHVDTHASVDEYLAAKLMVFELQEAGSTAFLPAEARWDELAEQLQLRGIQVHRFSVECDDSAEMESVSAGIRSVAGVQTVFWHHHGNRIEIAVNDIPARGLHQHLNIAIAAQVASDQGVALGVIKEALTSFRGLPHRLRYLGKVAGREWFDDSKATNPAAAIAALESFDQALWICGGLRKGVDLSELVPVVKKRVAKAFVIGLEQESYAQMLEAAGVPYELTDSLEQAVRMIAQENGDTPALLSPAAASMDQFESYAHRGRVFQDAVNALRGKP